MKTNQLPPGLVEKINNVRQETGFGDGFHVSDVIGNKAVNEIAQIAVQYADQQSFEVFELLNKDLKELKQQRDELIECLSRIVHAQYDKQSTLANLNGSVHEGRILLDRIKKLEDGKE